MALTLILGAAGGSLILYQNRERLYSMRHTHWDSPRPYGGKTEFELALEKIKSILPEEDIDMDEASLRSHGHSAWSYHNLGHPQVVITPHTIQQVSEVVKVAAQYRIPIIPFGGGTSIEGHYTAPKGGICLDMHHFDTVQVNEADMQAVVGSGVSWELLNEALKGKGLFFPADPGPGAKIGGMISVGCSGTNSVRYGTIRDWVLSITAVLPDGSVVKTRRAVLKSAAGYNLTQLLIGAEGTLGVIVEATLKLAPIPKEMSVALCDFPTTRSAANVVHEVVQSGIQIGAIEFLDDVMIKCVNMAYPKQKLVERPTLYFKFSGNGKQQVENDVKLVGEIVRKHGGGKFRFANSETEKAEIWEGRKTCLLSAAAMQPEKDIWTTDVIVPVSKLPELIAQTQADLKSSFLLAPMVGHVGDGNYHLIILFNKDVPKEVDEAARLSNTVVDRALALGGSCTGEHGVGIGKKKYLIREHGEETLKMMWKIKEAIDPLGIMNPEKVLPRLSGDDDGHH
ncbi:hypothetical protein SeMB42_g05000 [Synchytrium endobioticum]|nr:hypothetical protein SeMB42_g05000 [Synchytrium endobioticum]